MHWFERSYAHILIDNRITDEDHSRMSLFDASSYAAMVKQAGVDVLAYRRRHPDFRFVGAFDKMCMHRGEQALRAEFERLFLLMREGGHIPGGRSSDPAGGLARRLQALSLAPEGMLREGC